jgi:hypothetical protein
MLLVLGSTLLGIACSSSDSSIDPTGQGQGQGTLTVRVHDQAAPGIAEAWLTFEAVQAVSTSGSFEDVQGVGLQTPINLAELVNGNDAMLAAGALPAGSYTGLRISVSAITLVLDDGSTVDVLNGSFGIEIVVAVDFTVTEGQDTSLSVDIPLSAFQYNGGFWTFDPASVTTD